MDIIAQREWLRRWGIPAIPLLFLLIVAVRVAAFNHTPTDFVRTLIALIAAGLLVLRPKRGPEMDPVSRAATAGAAAAAVVMITAGLSAGSIGLQWWGGLALTWAALARRLRAPVAIDLRWAFLTLALAHPPSPAFARLLDESFRTLSLWLSVGMLRGIGDVVWTHDGMLSTGFRAYEIPAWAGGAKAALAALPVAAGLAFLFGARLRGAILLMILATLQTAALNAFRLALLTRQALAETDTIPYLEATGPLLDMGALLLPLLQVSVWSSVLNRRHTGDDPMPADVSHPPAWLEFLRWRKLWFAIALAIAAVVVCAIRSRPSALRECVRQAARFAESAGNPAEALAAARKARSFTPSDLSWDFMVIRQLLTLERAADALAELDAMPSGSNEPDRIEKNILRAAALTGLGRESESRAVIGQLPPHVRQYNPRVAMLLAEMAYADGDPSGVARHVPTAAGLPANLPRIRMFFPYLRQHMQWDAIAAADKGPIPDVPEAALALCEAHMHKDNTPRTAAILTRELARRPDDPRLLEPLFFMTLKWPDSDWDARYASHLIACANATTDPDILFRHMESCVRIARADLLWRLYRRLHSIDPAHPALDTVAGLYADQWFTIRARLLRLPSTEEGDTLDLRPWYLVARRSHVWRDLWAWVPLAEELWDTAGIEERRTGYLRRAAATFRDRHDSGALSTEMHYAWARILDRTGDLAGAVEVLRRVGREQPAEQARVPAALAALYEEHADWPSVYEALQANRAGPYPDLESMLRLSRAQLRLGLRPAAAFTAREAVRRHPYSAFALGNLAGLLLDHGDPAQALALLSGNRVRNLRVLEEVEARALFESERFVEADAFAGTVLLPRPQVSALIRQRYTLPPAEDALRGDRVLLPSEELFARQARLLRESPFPPPFLSALSRVWLAAYDNPASTVHENPLAWEAAGRDRIEKASALSQLVLLLARRGARAEARAVAQRSVTLMPEASELWLWLIGLSDGDGAIIRRARAACPWDPELWLAALVDTARHSPEDLMPLLDEASREPRGRRLPAETFTRAGEFLLRSGLREPAAAAARAAAMDARTLLPAYVLGVQCAIGTGDRAWAQQSAINAISSALKPDPTLYRKVVEIRTAEGTAPSDQDLVEALKRLRKADPDNPAWTELLGWLRYHSSNWEMPDAVTQMTMAIDAGSTNRLPFVIGAEASRQLGNTLRAADILRRGLARRPGDIVLLNNYLDLVRLTPDGLTEALTRLPELLAHANNDPRMLDTAAAICVSAGLNDEARRHASRVVELSPEGSPLRLRGTIQLGRIEATEGKFRSAVERVERQLKATRGLPEEEVEEAHRLLSLWRDQLTERSAVVIPSLDVTNRLSGR